MLRKKIDKSITALLNKDELLTLNLKGIISNHGSLIHVDDDNDPSGVYVNENYFNYVYTKNVDFIEEMLSELKGDTFIGFSGTNKEVRDYLFNTQVIHWRNPCSQLYYDGNKYGNEEIIEDIGCLTLDDAKLVNANYEFKNDESLNKIMDAIKNRPTSCVRLDGVPVSYAALHEDDSMGYMYTEPDYRGKGYAYEVTKDMINKTMESGRIPFVHIAQGNEHSMGLAKKAGFKKNGEVYWFGILNSGGNILKNDIKKYKDHFKRDCTHLSTKLNLTLLFEAVEVDVEIKETYINIKVDSVTYKINYLFNDELYFFEIENDLPVKILKSGLIKFMMGSSFACLINLPDGMQDEGFKAI